MTDPAPLLTCGHFTPGRWFHVWAEETPAPSTPCFCGRVLYRAGPKSPAPAVIEAAPATSFLPEAPVSEITYPAGGVTAWPSGPDLTPVRDETLVEPGRPDPPVLVLESDQGHAFAARPATSEDVVHLTGGTLDVGILQDDGDPAEIAAGFVEVLDDDSVDARVTVTTGQGTTTVTRPAAEPEPPAMPNASDSCDNPDCCKPEPDPRAERWFVLALDDTEATGWRARQGAGGRHRAAYFVLTDDPYSHEAVVEWEIRPLDHLVKLPLHEQGAYYDEAITAVHLAQERGRRAP